MVGEGVMLECLAHPEVSEVLVVSRKAVDAVHPKLTHLIVPDFEHPGDSLSRLAGFDACFFCAGVSSIGMGESKYTRLTYDTTLSFATSFLSVNPASVFTYVSGAHTDSTESGRIMWARVKGKTENDLMRLGFRSVYNFRPGVMLPVHGQKNWKKPYEWIAKVIRLVAPSSVLSVGEVGRAMINATRHDYQKHILEVSDIRQLADKTEPTVLK